MGNLPLSARICGRDGDDLPGDQSQTSVTAELQTLVEQQLHTDANTQERLASAGEFADRLRQAALRKGPHAWFKGPNARKQETTSRGHLFWPGHQTGLTSNSFHRSGDAIQITDAVVDDVNHPAHSTITASLLTLRPASIAAARTSGIMTRS